MKKILAIGLFGVFIFGCSNGTQIEQEELTQLEQEITELEKVDHELDEIKEEGDSLEIILNEIEK